MAKDKTTSKGDTSKDKDILEEAVEAFELAQ